MAASNLSTSSTNLTSSPPNPFSSPRSSSQISILTKKLNIKCKLLRTNNNNAEQESISSAKLERRNVLLGLGAAGLYALGDPKVAVGSPVSATDFKDCGKANVPPTVIGLNCCPPPATKITDFTPLSGNEALRERPAAHLVDAGYIEKYNKAISLMKALPDSDPRSFKQQANVHCA